MAVCSVFFALQQRCFPFIFLLKNVQFKYERVVPSLEDIWVRLCSVCTCTAPICSPQC